MFLYQIDKEGKIEESKTEIQGLENVKDNPDLVAQAVLVYRNNERQANATTKDRSQVRGGGRKPWAQKGTGRARHGSIRSPIWRGGGVTFGPTERTWSKRLPKKMKMNAFLCVFKNRAIEKELLVADYSDIGRSVVADLGTVMMVTENNEEFRKYRNMDNVTVVRPQDLNVLHLVSTDFVVIDKEGMNKLEERFAHE